jgi:hypothetical protein
MGNSNAFPTVLSLATALVFFAFIGTALASPDTRCWARWRISREQKT